MSDKNIKKLCYAGLFLALGMVLPFFTMQIKEIGDSLLPMHFAVMLCGLFCGWKYGLLVGAVTPILRSAVFGMPPMFYSALWMALELATYGFVIGFLYYSVFKQRSRFTILSVAVAQIVGRIVWGVSKYFILGFGGKPFTLYMFFVQGFVDALPGIILQLVLIPIIIKLVKKI